MDTKQAQLYAKILAFEFDEPGACRTFSSRLAEENGWSEEFAARALFEYRRFLFLAMTAGHPVCPSEEVDDVWHLHLIYSRSYWQRLCGEVLERPLHHDPSRGGQREFAKHGTMYAETLASYRRIFAEVPPGDLWPTGAKRFAPRSNQHAIDAERYWLIRKPGLWFRFNSWWDRFGSGAAIASMAVAPLPMLGVVWDHPFNLKGPEFLQFYACVLLIAFLTAIGTRIVAKHTSRATSETDAGPLDAFQAAYLSGGSRWAAKTAVAVLVASQDTIITRTTPLRLGRFGAVKTNGHSLERTVHASMPAAPQGASWAAICRRSQDGLTEVADSLRSRGLVMSPARAFVAHVVPLAIMTLAIAIGMIKVIVGLERHRPVGYLAMICFAATLITLAVFARRVHRTGAGDQRLLSLKVGHKNLRAEARQSDFSAQSAMPLAVALFGFGVLMQGPHQHLARSLDPRARFDRSATGQGNALWGSGCGGVGAGCGAGGHLGGGDAGGGGHGCGGGGGAGGCGGGGGGCGGGGCGGCGGS